MALVSCPECGKQISDSTPACPHCGYRVSVSSNSMSPAPTKIGDAVQNYKSGVASLVIGAILIPVSFFGFFIMLIPGIITFAFSIVLISAGISKISGTRSITCPHCGKISEVGKNFENHKCSVCKKRSVRDGDYLKPIL